MSRNSFRRLPIFVKLGGVVVVALCLIAVLAGDDVALQPWHKEAPPSEFEASDVDSAFGFDDYVRLEEEVFSEFEALLRTQVQSSFGMATSRYLPDGPNNPEGFPFNWNRTFVLESEVPVGSVLLLHGLTDSPYSLRALGQLLLGSGFTVVGIRLPGHGTVPEALDRVHREDWRAAVRVAGRHAAALRPQNSPFVIIGYSNGAALGLEYALDALEDATLPQPDRLVMLSPAVGITRFAMLAGLPRALRFLPFSESSRWTEIVPEIDPYKYSSFPANAGYQTHKLTVSNRRRVARLAVDGRGAELPPTLAFVSLADATVKMEAVASDLMMPLANPANEMVVFDVNRKADINALLSFDPRSRLAWLVDQVPLQWTFTAVTNEGPHSRAVVERRWRPGSEQPEARALGLDWPPEVYSLSHVALPFPPNDPLYGAIRDPNRQWGLPLGTLEPRGEKGLLRLSMDTVMRLRYNPFYSYLEERVLGFIQPG